MKKIMLSELEDFLDELSESDNFPEDIEPEEVQVSEDSIISIEGPEVTIPDLGIVAREGTMLQKDDEDGEFYPDWSLTVLYEIGKTPAEYLYYEQDGILVSLHNYLNAIGKEVKKSFDDIECSINL